MLYTYDVIFIAHVVMHLLFLIESKSRMRSKFFECITAM